MRLRDKVCVVTGSGSGIGRATAIEMAREGGKVVVSDLNDTRAPRRSRRSRARAARPSTRTRT
jgi:NAD(P)-dependent dehydrogenase (short-subunit alcohol dehydrogenase family)